LAKTKKEKGRKKLMEERDVCNQKCEPGYLCNAWTGNCRKCTSFDTRLLNRLAHLNGYKDSWASRGRACDFLEKFQRDFNRKILFPPLSHYGRGPMEASIAPIIEAPTEVKGAFEEASHYEPSEAPSEYAPSEVGSEAGTEQSEEYGPNIDALVEEEIAKDNLLETLSSCVATGSSGQPLTTLQRWSEALHHMRQNGDSLSDPDIQDMQEKLASCLGDIDLTHDDVLASIQDTLDPIISQQLLTDLK
jgi:hypothetical protein